MAEIPLKLAKPIEDPIVCSKKHQTYRIGYLKDIILPRALNEGMLQILIL
ncbi:hypothetical protein CASFOL_017394 [Castilleja foliolosa]|uniref:Serine/threonine-protein phosphatase 4 regulatory subunit 3-like central domain-containing protein n=1 Tax=Castilleja foliolosa TaxID=1961234 RepID=A0ABD3DCS0_9LAMI